MATYTADQYPASVPLTGSGEPGEVCKAFLVTLTAVTLSGADVIKLCRIPLGAEIHDWYIDLENLAATACELGDTGQGNGNGTTVGAQVARYCASNGVGTGLNSSYNDGVAGSVSFGYVVSDSILALTVTTASGEQVTGTIRGWLRYNMLANAF